MDKYLKGTYADLTVYTDKLAGEGVAVIQVDNDRNITFEVTTNEIDELIKALQEAKEVLARGRDTDE